MAEPNKTLTINTNVEITAESLEAIVNNVKLLSERNNKGHYNVDTAEKVNEMISRFLLENDFEGFVKDIENYKQPTLQEVSLQDERIGF